MMEQAESHASNTVNSHPHAPAAPASSPGPRPQAGPATGSPTTAAATSPASPTAWRPPSSPPASTPSAAPAGYWTTRCRRTPMRPRTAASLRSRSAVGSNRSRTRRHTRRAPARDARRCNSETELTLTRPGHYVPTHLAQPSVQASSGHRSHLRAPHSPRIITIHREVRAGETENGPDTVRPLEWTFVSRGVHCEAPYFARRCRAGGNGSTAVDRLWRWERQSQRQRQDRRRRPGNEDANGFGIRFGCTGS